MLINVNVWNLLNILTHYKKIEKIIILFYIIINNMNNSKKVYLNPEQSQQGQQGQSGYRHNNYRPNYRQNYGGYNNYNNYNQFQQPIQQPMQPYGGMPYGGFNPRPKFVKPFVKKEMSEEEIEKDLFGFKEYKEGCDIDFGSHVKYYTKDGEYRKGGTIAKVADDYFKVKALFGDTSWSLQKEGSKIYYKTKEQVKQEKDEMAEIYYHIKTKKLEIVEKKVFTELMKKAKAYDKMSK